MKRILLIALIGLCQLVPARADAKLAKTRFSELLKESQLIARVRVAEVHLDKLQAGYVLLEVIEVYKGEKPKDAIRIDYDSEVHDQYMTRQGEERVVFLTFKENRWYGAHYGRSYWQLFPTEGKEAGFATPYIYPITMLDFRGHKKLLVAARFKDEVPNANQEWEGKTRQMITLADLQAAIAAAAEPKPKK